MRTIVVLVLAAGTGFAGESEEKRVDAIFAEYARPGSPGCAVGVLQRGATALAKGYGSGDLEQNVPLTRRTRFYMASVSKQFTSMALLLAEQEGKLSLDDNIRKYVPELPAYADAITIRRMLDHTAGLRDYLALWSLRGFSNESVLREGPTVALIARQKALNFVPGTDQNYSNSGYLLAAVALHRATGKPLNAYAKEKIYSPLEMHSTRFQADHGEPMPDRAHGYYHRDGGWKTADVGFDLIGSGGMYSNVEDMLRWARNFEKPMVGANLLKTLQIPGKLVDGRPTPGGYALGMIERNGTYSHSGGAVGYSTYFLRVPKSEATVVCLCNIGGTPVAQLAEQVAAVYTGDKAVPRDPAVPTERAAIAWRAGEMAKLAGSYWSEELFSVWQLAEREGKLWVQSDGPELPVEPAGNDLYIAGGFEIKPARGADGRAMGFEAGAGRARGISFARR
ncbi:MAG: serine hydrolase domain-containing protein [Bryobacteraceae bacterium]